MKIKVNLSLFFLLKNRVHPSLPLSISPSFIHSVFHPMAYIVTQSMYQRYKHESTQTERVESLLDCIYYPIFKIFPIIP